MASVIIAFFMVFWLVSCASPDSSNGVTNSPSPANTGYVASNHQGDPNSTFASGSCGASGNYGGVTCSSGQSPDQEFLNFVSNGTNINPKSRDYGLGQLNCQPSNTGGILIRVKVLLNAPFNSSGSNDSLVMQPDVSTLEVVIYDNLEGQKPLSFIAKGSSGEVIGNKAHLNFIYIGENGQKTMRLDGTFDANLFTGDIFYTNSQYWDGTTPGASGKLGSFKISTCAVFTSQ